MLINGCSDEYMHVQDDITVYVKSAQEFLENMPMLIYGVVALSVLQFIFMCILNTSAQSAKNYH